MFRLLLILSLFLSGCAETPTYPSKRPISSANRKPRPPIKKPKPATKAQTPSKIDKVQADIAKQDFVTVKKGDTLYSIGFGSGIGYELLSEWNNIPKPYHLEIGQQIKLYDPRGAKPLAPDYADNKSVAPTTKAPTIIEAKPIVKAPENKVIEAEPLIKAPTTTVITLQKPKDNKDSSQTADKNSPPPVKKSEISAEETSRVSKDNEKMLKLSWKWPIQGKILKNFVQTGNKGIDIEGQLGEAVKAAAAGEVVYSGNGLIGYGNLLIIKHDDLFLSAYANNASLQVNEGQKVNQGQAIARCGKSAAGIPSLHFEIRKNGKSVNPSLYLPAQ